MHRLALSFVILLIAGDIDADSPIACVDPDVANTLLNFPGQGTAAGFSTDLPAGVDVPSVPGSFTLIGSRRVNGATFVAYKSDLDARESKARFRQAALAEGWQNLTQRVFMQRGGFRAPGQSDMRSVVALCHDERGSANAFLNDRPGGGAYIQLMLTDQHGARCASPPMAAMAVPSMPELPLLDLPEDVELLDGAGRSGSSGYNATSMVFRSMSATLSTLHEHFRQQLLDQSWEEEDDLQGSVAAISSWLSSSRDRHLEFSIVMLGGSQYRVSLKVGALEPVNRGAGATSIRIGGTP